MKNWAKTIKWNPSEILYPSTELEIQKAVLKAAESKRKIRVIGTGHSFTPLSVTNEILISLDNYQGIVHLNKDTLQATVKGGTKLRALGELLFQNGIAMENLGDIDAQSIAGTIGTGTHGTGKDFGTISTQVVGLKLINGKGEIISCNKRENPDLFRAAQVSLGSLGIITEVTLQCVPIYKLALQNDVENIHDIQNQLDERIANNRNFEYYWIPYTNTAWTKTSNIVKDAEPDKINFFNFWTEYVMENYVFKLACEWARWIPNQNKNVAKLTANGINPVKKVYYSHKIYATKRLVRFHEMEYNIPAENYHDIFQEVMKVVNSRKYPVHFPIENRWVKQDDIMLSPAYGRDSAYIACHMYHKKDPKSYFEALEAIFLEAGGRPHWGKMNTLKAKDFSMLYPEFSAFLKIRKEQDPEGIFISKYIRSILGGIRK